MLLTARWVWLGLGLLLLIAPLATRAQATAEPPGRLVSAEWLRQNLARQDLLILDASPGPMHRQGHIPGAVPATVFSSGIMDVSAPEAERRLRAWGVGPGRLIVVVDPGGTYFAPRLFWDLLHAGVPATQLHLLDGGMARWVASGGAVTKEATPTPAPSTVRVAAMDDSVRVRLPEFLAATADPQRHVMLEALDPEYFYGGAAFFNRGGHVPHATLMPSDDLFNADKTFKSPDELRRQFAHLGVRRDQEVLTYCGGGGAAAVPYFALKVLLEHPRVRMFQESQYGWLQDERELPLWTYGAPNLLRETSWLKGWTSPMLRAFGISRVSVVDVRSEAQFGLGHVGPAVNVTASEFARLWPQPQELAARLGQAGVERSHEAVVVSERGLDADAALAFVALERLGQQRVSIFLDSLERWAELGQVVARPAAASGAASSPATRPATPPAAAVRPVAYAPQLKTDRLVQAGTAATPGAMPRVYIASGAALPARPPAGRVLHLPYAGFLDAEGRPKAAKDIWALLAKAGVPRYAELVTVADAPGDAAINYVVLRLMGLADVKLLMP